MAMNSGLRSSLKMLASSESIISKSVNRGIHSTRVTRMGGGHGHGEPEYMHAKHMYNLDKMKHQKLTATLSVIGVLAIGCGVPLFACSYQQKKTASA